MGDQEPAGPDRPRPVPPPRRIYRERPKGGPKDVQSDERLRAWMPFMIGAGIGFIWSPFMGIPVWIGAPLVGGGVYAITQAILALGGKIVSEGIYGASGATTPHKSDYSRPESLAVSGHHEQAIVAYEAVLSEFPEDPEPYIRIARMYRDELDRLDEAVKWFRRTRVDAKLDTARELAVTQELVDIYLHRMNTPNKAIPELARTVERFPGTPFAQWAEQQLVELRQRMREEEP